MCCHCSASSFLQTHRRRTMTSIFNPEYAFAKYPKIDRCRHQRPIQSCTLCGMYDVDQLDQKTFVAEGREKLS
ncbi:hypothetical protein Forpe1208_v007132 [Fusarium oxysporum f. sp. rapae]|uniref:Uncharacterized protein n=1 Tax=Fusarium oxysporum f. sp. rapae TaxID=485398 RepID=A0A8J5NX94_FUSOX|nr:hypothetical protein Forpe1208_v007132 [Fusarium oxysporum f. sp. rapae]